MKRLKPLNDFIFKKLFGENEVKDNLIAFLNAVLDRKDKEKLVTIEILDNKELTPELINDKPVYQMFVQKQQMEHKLIQKSS